MWIDAICYQNCEVQMGSIGDNLAFGLYWPCLGFNYKIF